MEGQAEPLGGAGAHTHTLSRSDASDPDELIIGEDQGHPAALLPRDPSVGQEAREAAGSGGAEGVEAIARSWEADA